MKIEWIKGKTDNCYIVSEGKDAILVDTASGESYEKVLEECSKYNMRLIVLTHVHFDHAENAEKLSEHFGVPVGVDVEGTDLIVGDALDNWITPATGHLYSDKNALKASAEKIRALGARKIYYGHGKPTESK